LTFERACSIVSPQGTRELRKTLLAASVLLLASVTCFGLEFRSTTWLMTGNQVMAAEPGQEPIVRNLPGQQEIEYHVQVYGRPAVITYLLESDKLLSASYTFRKDLDLSAWETMKADLASRKGPPAFQTDTLVGWRLERTEIALTHRADGTTYVAFWEKSYFARINGSR
jgi:hypothetical protein